MFRGDGVAKGYWNKPEETKVAFLDDGWMNIEVKLLGHLSVLKRDIKEKSQRRR
jgi:long-subunit acyl-CoA synthetase (AMP-forming)